MASEKRLIDANAMVTLMCRACNNECWEDPCEPGECFIYDALANAPTVEAVEVVHAHWEDGCAVDPKTGRIIYKSIDCSHCEEIFKIESHDREYWKKRFKVCPFCGAVMDGGNEDV